MFLGGGPGSAIRSFWEWLANLGQQGKQVKPGYEHHCVCLAWIRLSGESCCSCPRSCQNLLDPGSETPLTGVSIARRFGLFLFSHVCGGHFAFLSRRWGASSFWNVGCPSFRLFSFLADKSFLGTPSGSDQSLNEVQNIESALRT